MINDINFCLFSMILKNLQATGPLINESKLSFANVGLTDFS